MVSELFDMSKKKSAFDVVTLAVMAFQILLYLVLPTTFKQWLFLFLFLGWRAGYNAGLGYLLKQQSDRRALVVWAREKGIFDKNRHNPWYEWLKVDLSAKMGKDYQFEVRSMGCTSDTYVLSDPHDPHSPTLTYFNGHLPY